MLVRCLLPMELETGPGTKKSSTLCSFLLVIATFLVLEVPGQSNNDGSVGVANHKLIGKKVTLVNYTIEANETNFNSDEYRMRIPNACDVKIDNDTIELQYNNSGCTVDLLIKNEDYNKKIKFKAGVRNKGGELKSCLKNAVHVKYSSNNIMPFVYSKNNKVVERLSHGPIYDHEDKCNKQQCGLCMPWTTLEISWSKSGRDVYAYTHLVGEVELGEKLRITQGGNEIVTFDMEVEGVGKFKMGPNSFKASKNVLCVPENNPIVEPETWTITNENLINRRLLVFSMLPVNASVGTHDGTKFAGTPPPGPHCNLFVQFDRNNYELLFVSLPPQTTTTTISTTKSSSKDPETPETSTCAPCPSSTSVITTTTAKNISSPAVKCPAESKCPKESKGWLFYLILVVAIVEGLIIIGILAWFTRSWKKGKHSCEKECMTCTKYEQYLYGLYSAEPQVGEKIKTFAAWKEEKKLDDPGSVFNCVPIETLAVAMWNRAKKEKIKDKLQFLVDEFVKHRDKEIYDREYAPELTKKGYDGVGSFQEWKMERNINPFEVIDGTTTAIEYGESKILDKPLLPGASIDGKRSMV